MDNGDSLYTINFTWYSTLPTYMLLAFNQFWELKTLEKECESWYTIKVHILDRHQIYMHNENSSKEGGILIK